MSTVLRYLRSSPFSPAPVLTLQELHVKLQRETQKLIGDHFLRVTADAIRMLTQALLQYL